jgi:ABC-2 type transport system ATP-binding protein
VPAALETRGLVKRFGSLTAVDGIDLLVREGECFGLLGPNGAGKTTTVEILEGLQEPTAGDVAVLGMRWDRDARRIRERIGVQLQETVLQGLLTVLETLRLFASFYPRARPAADVLEDVGLEEKASARVQALSGGQRQRLAVGCALVSDPDVLFLDEPTTGLDPAARRALWEVIRRYRERGRTVLLTTHYMEEAERLCDRIAMVDRGRVQALGTPAELIARVGGEEVVEIATEPPIDPAALRAVEGVRSVSGGEGGARLVVQGLARVLPALLARVAAAGATPVRLATRHATLEDVFLQTTGRRFEDADAAGAAAAAAEPAGKAGTP